MKVKYKGFNIIPFNDLFNPIELERIDFNNNCFINQLSLITKIVNSKLPIANTRLALKNILKFLHYLDNEIEKYDSKDKIIPISKEKFVEYFTCDKYIKYQKLLHDLEILTAVSYDDGKYFEIGKSFKIYRVHNYYLKDKELALVVFDDIEKPKFNNYLPELDQRYTNTIKELEIDTTKAVYAEIINHQTERTDLSNLKLRVNRIFATKRDRFIKKGNKVNRVYHSFSNISKVSRKFLNIPLINIDIVNCQPLLLVYHLISNNLPIDDSYISDCENGVIYERFTTPTLSRDDAKVQLYKSIFFSFQDRFKVNKKFKSLYPLTHQSLELIKHQSQNGGKKLAGLLQNIEAELFNNLIPKNSTNYFTLFDAIYFSDITDLYELENYIKDYFNKLNVKVTTKKEL